jgi:competence protein ComEC
LPRPVAWLIPALACCLGLGAFLGDRLEPNPGWVVGLAATSLVFAALCRRSVAVCVSCVCMLAFALGTHGVSRDLTEARLAASRAGIDAAVLARVCHVRRAPDWIAAELCGLVGVPFGLLVPVGSLPARVRLVEPRASAEGEWLEGVSVGDTIRARLRLARGGGLRNPGAQDRDRPLRRRGIGVRARILDARLAVRVDDGTSDSRPGLREGLAARLLDAGRGGGLLACLGLGSREGLALEDREAFRRLGISHLLAVSGLHVALVAGLVYGLAGWGGRRFATLTARWDVRTPALAAACAASLAYGVLAGWETPVQRAFALVLATVCVLVSRRRKSPVHALAAAALVIGVLQPAAFFDLGAHLSFVATAALLGSAARPEARGASARGGVRGAVGSALSGSLRVSATAIVATAPVLAWNGLASTPVGLLSNTIAVPITALLLLPLALLSTAVAALDVGWSGGLLALLVRPAALVLEGAGWLASGLPATALELPPHPIATAAAAIVSILAIRAQRTGVKVALCCTVCVALALAPPSRVRPEPPRVVVFDVGLGDAILVQGREAAVLVDGGWAMPDGADLGRSTVVPGLRALGVDHLDVMVVSHADADHRGGLPSVLSAIGVGELWIPPGSRSELLELVEAAGRRRVPIRERGLGDPPEGRGDLVLHVLWPPPDAGRESSRNDRSLVLRIDVAGSRVLLTGDIGRDAEAALVASGSGLRAEVLKVPHHGSRHSSSPEFLAAVSAEVALVSAPCSQRGRLPTREALERLRASGASVWWTGRDGALIGALRSDFPTRTWWAWSFDPLCKAR